MGFCPLSEIDHFSFEDKIDVILVRFIPLADKECSGTQSQQRCFTDYPGT